ncbi:hypothetical protein TRIUR3_15004 [Triticum urartu]|uniref:Pectinesterase inhibitor domain-containing protein n=1 Tax=Triticum urartu TaxID=4572 RepID=M7YA64_TRIUA|nr:hypothetical protein TRIUR3_15004 [Triticum urartu]
MLFSSSIVPHTSGDVGGKPKAADFVTKACKNATANYDKEIHLTEKFCVSTLRSDNRSEKAKDLRDLALIGVDILKARVVTANGKVQEMLHKAKTGTSMMRRLTFCKLDYDVTVNTLSGYCGHDLPDMPELHALFNENLDLSMLAHLNMALLAPYKDNDS